MFFNYQCNECGNVMEKNISLREHENNFENGKQKSESELKCPQCQTKGKLSTVIGNFNFSRFWESCH